MLESQLQPIHKEIAEMYEEDDTVALSTLAHHWLVPKLDKRVAF